MPLKRCPQCKEERPLDHFTKNKARSTKEKIRYYSTCKPCMRLRYRQWMYKNQHKVIAYENLRATFKNRKTPICAYCHIKGDLHWYKFNNQRALYHDNCATQRFYSLGLIPPSRIKELQLIADGGLI